MQVVPVSDESARDCSYCGATLPDPDTAREVCASCWDRLQDNGHIVRELQDWFADRDLPEETALQIDDHLEMAKEAINSEVQRASGREPTTDGR